MPIKRTVRRKSYQINLDTAVEKYADMVYRISMTITKNQCDAQDVSQEAFLRLVKYSNKIKDEEHLKAWLIRVTINCAKSVMTNAWNKKTQGFGEDLEDTVELETKEQETLFEQIRNLPKNYAVSLYLYYYEEYSIKEISHITHKNENTIKSTLSRARTMLRRQLEQEGYSL